MTQHSHQTLTQTIRATDAQLTRALASRGISVDTYKALRFAFRAVGIAIVGLAILTPGIEPTPTMLLVLTAMVLGPDVVESYLTREQ